MRHQTVLVGVLLVAVLLAGGVCVTAEELTNDSRRTAVAVRVTFRNRVRITGHGREFDTVEPSSGLSDVFVFYVGELRRNRTFEIEWSPRSTAIKSVEWLEVYSVGQQEEMETRSSCTLILSPMDSLGKYLDNAFEGMEICLEPGVYKLEHQFSIRTAVSIRGLGDSPEDVILTCPEYSYFHIGALESGSVVVENLSVSIPKYSNASIYAQNGECRIRSFQVEQGSEFQVAVNRRGILSIEDSVLTYAEAGEEGILTVEGAVFQGPGSDAGVSRAVNGYGDARISLRACRISGYMYGCQVQDGVALEMVNCVLVPGMRVAVTTTGASSEFTGTIVGSGNEIAPSELDMDAYSWPVGFVRGEMHEAEQQQEAADSSPVQAPQAAEPTCKIQVSRRSGVAPLSIDYSATLKDCSDEINEYSWRFGDDEVISGLSGTHSFDYPGAYLIRAHAAACGAAVEDTEIVIVDPVYVNASAGSDLTADGSCDSPFATISAALRSTSDVRPIVVAEGFYSIASGEDETIRLGDGRSIVGSDPMARPHIAVPISCGNGSVLAQVQCSTVNVRQVRGVLLWDVLMLGFDGAVRNGVYVNRGGGVSVIDSHIAGFVHSIYVVHEGASGVITRCTVSATFAAIWYGGRATGSVSSCIINESHYGIAVAENASVSIEGSQIAENDNGVFVRDASVVDLGGGNWNSAGNNSFINNQESNIHDERSPYSGEISATGNNWNCDSSDVAAIVGPATAISSQERCYIQNQGNSIVISD